MGRFRLTRAFDTIADSYDRWYDSPEGRAIFNAELKCLRRLCEQLALTSARWLETGVGTGRFASMLGIAEGMDPSSRMLEIAAARGEIEPRSPRRPSLQTGITPDAGFLGLLFTKTNRQSPLGAT
jgi:ubiquinone/menaquinone biosynthesis C-methylase UbiE